MKGRKVITIYNDGYKCDYESKKRCAVCYQYILREAGKHFGICPGCNAYDFSFYKLTPTQQAIVTDPSKIVIALGAMNNGKTDAGVYWAILRHVLLYSNATMLIISHSLESIQQTVLNTIKSFLPEGLVDRRNGKLRWNTKGIYLKNGSEILFFPADQEGKYRSLNASGAYIPEFTVVKKRVAIQVASRIRKKVLTQTAFVDSQGILRQRAVEDYSEMKNIGQLYMDGNPEEHSWVLTQYLPYVNKIFISRDSDISDLEIILKPRAEMKDISLHNYPTSANPYSNDGNFMELQETTYKGKDSGEYQRYILGKIVSSKGLIYPNYRQAMITPFQFEVKDYNYYFGADLGWENPCAYVGVAEHKEDGKLYVFRGYKKSNIGITENAKLIKATELGIPEEQIVARKCDSQGNAVTHGTDNRSPIQKYATEGIDFTSASKQLAITISHLNELINQHRLFIFDNLTDLLAEFPRYVYQHNDRTGVREIKKKNCDMLDALRYACEDITARNEILSFVQQKRKENRYNPLEANVMNTDRYVGQNN